tara:strand:- start:14035 stop:17271 length:3237 start_codon:yes stop_codon:yes gene_type:complete
MANIKNFGIKGVAADIQFGKGGGFMVYDKSNNKFQVKDSGSSLEDIEFATVLAGTWAGTAIAVTKGGTGLTSVAQDKILYTTGANTFGSTDITATGIALLGSANAGAGRTALGLGTIATQANTAVDIDGGTIDGTIIGGSTAAAGSFTTVNASGTITGDLTGTVTGNADTATTLAAAVTIGGVSFDGSANITLPGVNATGNQNTSGTAAGLTSGQTIGMTGDVAWTSASFDGTGAVTGTSTLATVYTGSASVGSTTAIPVLTIDGKGRITATSTATIATSFNIAADSGTADAVNGGETLTFAGTTNEIETTVTGNQIQIGLVANPTIGGDLTVSGNLTVSGTRTDVNVTNMAVEDSLVSYATGNSSDAVDIGFFGKYNDGSNDLATGLFRDANDGKFHLFAGSQETISGNVVDKTATGYSVASLKANTEGTHTGAVVGNVTGDTSGSAGTVTSIAAHILDEDNMATNSATLVPSQQSVKAYVDTEIAGITSDFTLAADSGTNDTFSTGGTLTFNGTTNQIETTVSNDAITVGLVSSPTVSGTVTAGGFAGPLTGNVTGNADTATLAADATTLATARLIGGVSFDGSANITLPGVNSIGNQDTSGESATVTSIAAHVLDEDNMATDSATQVPSQQSVKAYVDTEIAAAFTDTGLVFQGDSGGALSVDLDSETLTIAGGTGISSVGSGNGVTLNLDATAVTAGSYGSSSAIPTFTVDAQGRLTAAGTASISTSWTLTGDTGTETVNGGDTVDIAGGNNITTVAGATDTLTINLNSVVSGLTSVSATTVTGTTVTDGTATLTGGALSGVTSVGAVDMVLSGNLTVNGSTTSVSSTNTTIADTLIELQSGLSGGNSSDIGIVLERGTTGDNGFMGWDESEDKFAFATTTATGTSTGDLTLADAGIKVGDVLSSGTVTFASLSDGVVTVTAFVDEDNMASDSATLVPTQQSVKAYVDSQVAAVDDTVLRASFTANSVASSFNIGTMPSTAGRTYVGSKLTIKVSTGFAGDSVDGIVVNDGTNDLMLVAQNDPTVTGLYVVDLGAEGIAAGATISCSFKAADGSTASTPTSGACTATVEYQFYT